MDKLERNDGKKICIIYFGSLSRHPDKLHLWFGNEIVERFGQERILEKVFCFEADGLNVYPELVYEFSGSLYAKFAHAINILLSRLFPKWTRKVTEIFFGIFVTSKLDFSKIDTLFFLRATNKIISLQAKRKGKRVGGMISIFPRSLIASHIRREEMKWNIIEKSDYTNQNRIKEFDQIMTTWDFIIPWTNTEVVKNILNTFPFASKVRFAEHEYGVNQDVFYLREMPPLKIINFLVVTDGTLKKGLLNLLAVWPHFQRNCKKEVRLKVVGNLGKDIFKVINQNLSLDNVELVGYVNNVQAYIEDTHIFICPSIIDMGPRTIKQAMKCGRMVIASNLCGHSSCIEPFKEGLVFDPLQPDSLLQCLKWIEVNYQRIPLIGKAASKKAETFDDKKFAESIYTIVNQNTFSL